MPSKFRKDALRWVIPSQFAHPDELNLRLLIYLLYQYMPLRAMAWYRLGCWLKEKRVPVAFGLIHRWLYFRFGLEIWGDDIGGGLYIAHSVGTVIAVKTMGENCSVIASTTIGMRNEYAFPTIGDNVFIGAGARVLGNITVGDNVKVGANAVVIHDVADNETVIGIPAKPMVAKKKEKAAGGHLNGQAEYHQSLEV